MSSFAGNELGGFVPPPFYNFKPFFTLQPIVATREKQLKLWRELLLQYHSFHKLYTMPDPSTFVLFRNESLSRSLNKEAIKAVVDSLIAEGLAEWEEAGSESRTLIIMLTSPAAMASKLSEWANNSGNIDTILTFYEIRNGDGYTASPFADVDKSILRKALELLQDKGQVVIFKGDNSDEDGIKFII